MRYYHHYRRLPRHFGEKIMTSLRITLLSLALAIAGGAAFALELPDPKDHEFNSAIPTEFRGEMITMTDSAGGKFPVYVTGETNAEGAILLIHEWWGLNAHIKGLADQFANLGYTAYAIDLYDGKVTDNPEEARKFMGGVDPKASAGKMKAAIERMRRQHKRIGTIGWCFGGGNSLKASIDSPVEATVVYYGHLIDDPVELVKLRGPLLGIFADKDTWITPGKVDAFEKGLNKAGVYHLVLRFDADHAFANPSGHRFMEEPAVEAWEATLRLFDRYVK